jgi:hypothetical protein
MPLRLLTPVLGAFMLAACQSAPEQPPAGEFEQASVSPDAVSAVDPQAGVAGDPAAVSFAPAAERAARAGADDTMALDPSGGPCVSGESVRIWAMPLAPRPGEPMRMVAVATDAALDRLLVTDPNGERRPLNADASGGPPWSLQGTLVSPATGTYRVETVRDGRLAGCAEIPVGGEAADRGSGDWDRAAEALYAVWVERLFDAPVEQSLSFPSLAPVLADPRRNLLHNYLGTSEDNGLVLEPDCADLPYILRGYFGWKLGLPVTYRACSRGSANSPPRCEAATVETSIAGPPASTKVFRDLSRRIMDRVHSGSGRTALADEATDFYPVPLERAALWPGTLYADPYGHTLVIVKWVPQTGSRSGMLLAVDAQPDNSVSRKRFWEGNFLFAETPSAGPGFKAVRPLTRAGGTWQPLANAALSGGDGAPPYSTEQAGLSPDAFYARMERLINPSGLDPTSAYEETLAALMEQLETRVASVNRGEDYMRSHGGQVVPMPVGAAIFETTGPWEDYSTPSRDMRLLIAMRVLEGLPERIRRYPELYRLGGETPEQAATRIEALHAARIQERGIEYSRSDGSPWRLSVAELYARRPALEWAYNPNDCVERRWGASTDSQEHATCTRRAPKDQQARMEQYRSWFRDTRRPPR